MGKKCENCGMENASWLHRRKCAKEKPQIPVVVTDTESVPVVVSDEVQPEKSRTERRRPSSHAVTPPPPPHHYAPKSYTGEKRFVLVIDVSGSMNSCSVCGKWDYKPHTLDAELFCPNCKKVTPTRYQVAIGCIKEFFESQYHSSINPDDVLRVVVFPQKSPRFFEEDTFENVMHNVNGKYVFQHDLLSSLKPDGATPLWRTLERVFSDNEGIWADDVVDYVMLISDGEDTMDGSSGMIRLKERITPYLKHHDDRIVAIGTSKKLSDFKDLKDFIDHMEAESRSPVKYADSEDPSEAMEVLVQTIEKFMVMDILSEGVKPSDLHAVLNYLDENSLGNPVKLNNYYHELLEKSKEQTDEALKRAYNLGASYCSSAAALITQTSNNRHCQASINDYSIQIPNEVQSIFKGIGEHILNTNPEIRDMPPASAVALRKSRYQIEDSTSKLELLLIDPNNLTQTEISSSLRINSMISQFLYETKAIYLEVRE